MQTRSILEKTRELKITNQSKVVSPDRQSSTSQALKSKSRFMERHDTFFEIAGPVEEDCKSITSTKSKMKIIPIKTVASKPQVAKQMAKIERDVKQFELNMIDKSINKRDLTQTSKGFVETREKCSNAYISSLRTGEVLNNL